MMSIGNKKIDAPRKYQYQIGIWYFCLKFLGILLVFYRYFENVLLKIWLNIGIFWQNKIGFVFGFWSCHFIGIGLVSVCNFYENDTSSCRSKTAGRKGSLWHKVATTMKWETIEQHSFENFGLFFFCITFLIVSIP